MLTPDIDDLFDIYSEVTDVAAKWKNFGLALRLRPDQLETIEANPHTTVEDCLRSVLSEWLKQTNINTERFGVPSWKLLLAAVAHPNGGQNRALAIKLAAKYNG